MAANLSTLRELVRFNIGGRTDANANTVIDASINYAAKLAALIFDPPELYTTANVAVAANEETVSLANVSNLLDIIDITHSGNAVYFVPYELWRTILKSSIGALKFYTRYGDVLYVRDAPASNTSLTIAYRKYPAELTANDSALDFDHHDSHVVSFASAIALAALEETDSANMWLAINQAIGLPLLIGRHHRHIISGIHTSFETAISGGNET